MRNTQMILAAAVGVALAGATLSAARAADLKPIQSQSIDLGNVLGDAYYTAEPDGFHVVATFAQRDGSRAPVRFQTVLAPGQAVVISSPRGVGEQPVSYRIERQDARVIVAKAAMTN